MLRLAQSTLGNVPPQIERFTYDRRALRPRIVHLGLGAFFRAHGALHTEDCAAAGGNWGIVGVSLQRPDQRNRLAGQDFLYSATEKGPNGRHSRIVGNLLDVLVAPENPRAVVRRLAHPETAIVTLTITEKGYCHDPATGQLKTEHADIQHDLANLSTPRTAIGLVAAALRVRWTAGLDPFTVASCDNLPGNGRLLRGLVLNFARNLSSDLAAWISDTVMFPASMVDRIVPAETPDDIAAFEREAGLHDSAPVSHEPFRQWVMEDRFTGNKRPAWEAAGAQFVGDVTPFEHAKLRMLNGTHSGLAYLGYLAGHETIADTIADPPFAAFVWRLWNEEIIPSLKPPPGTDLGVYAGQLFERYRNPAIRHRTWQIAMDGSQKLPQRLLGTLRDQLRDGRPVRLLSHAIAGWMHYVEGTDEYGQAIDVRDPLRDVLQARLRTAGSEARARVASLLAIETVFGGDLALHAGFVDDLAAAYDSLRRLGVRQTLINLTEP